MVSPGKLTQRLEQLACEKINHGCLSDSSSAWMAAMKATVVITTRNRADDLRRALRSCMQQSCRPEVLVVDDASTDETVSMVRSEFPSVRLTVHERPTGYIVGRNEAADTAAGDVIVSIDDDAEFTHADVVAEALQGFGAPRVGAVAIPYIDVRKSEGVRQLANSAEGTWVTDRYIGTAHGGVQGVLLPSGRGARLLPSAARRGLLCQAWFGTSDPPL